MVFCIKLVFEFEDLVFIYYKDDIIFFCKILMILGCCVIIEYFGENFVLFVGLRVI